MTEPSRPTINPDGLEAVVVDTDGVLTDTASVHAAAWKRLFVERAAGLAERSAVLVVDDPGRLHIQGETVRQGGR